MIGRGLAGHHRLDDRLEPLRLVARGLLVAVLELGQHLAPEQLEALHDVLVAVLARLRAEDHLVDAALLVAPQVVAHLVRRADRAAQPEDAVLHDLRAEPVVVRAGRGDRFRVVALLRPPLLVLGPHVGRARRVPAEHVVVRERVPEEVRAFEPRAIAASSSSWHMKVVTHAIFALTASPIGTPSVASVV